MEPKNCGTVDMCSEDFANYPGQKSKAISKMGMIHGWRSKSHLKLSMMRRVVGFAELGLIRKKILFDFSRLAEIDNDQALN